MNGLNSIDKVGVEIEGGWKTARTDLIEDGSITSDQFYHSKSYGEYVSEAFDNKESLFKCIEENWPTEITSRAGYHVHFSLKDINKYSQCMATSFWNHFLDRMRKWGDEYPVKNDYFWARLGDQNRYCRRQFMPELQIKAKTKRDNVYRFSQLNYCYSLHKTIECRLFPVFKDFETAQAATNALLNCVEEYLEANPASNYSKPEELFVEMAEEEHSELDFKITNINEFKPALFNYFGYKIKTVTRKYRSNRDTQF